MRTFRWSMLACLVACSSYEAVGGDPLPAPPRGDGSDAACGLRCEADVDGPSAIDCRGERRACSLCEGADGAATCHQFDPYGPLTARDVYNDDELGRVVLAPLASEHFYKFNSGTGELRRGHWLNNDAEDNPVLRAPQAINYTEQIDAAMKVGFRLEDGRGIFRAKSFEINNPILLSSDSGAQLGAQPIVLVASEDIVIRARLSPGCTQRFDPSLEASNRGGHGVLASSTVAGSIGTVVSTPGGGGHFTGGGRGYAPGKPSSQYPSGGGSVSNWSSEVLERGGDGGLALLPGKSFAYYPVHNGGPAVQLVAGRRIVFERPANASESEPLGLSVDGCGAPIEFMLNFGGGGAGGTLLLEAPEIVLAPGTRLTADGGDGGTVRRDGTKLDLWRSSDPGAPNPRLDANDRCVGCGGNGERNADPGGELGDAVTAGGGGTGFVIVRSLNSAAALTEGVHVSPAPLLRSLLKP